MSYFMVCWREDFQSIGEDGGPYFPLHYKEEERGGFKLMVGRGREVIQEFLYKEYELMFEQNKCSVYDACLMHEFILKVISGYSPLQYAVNDVAIEELASRIHNCYWGLVRENYDYEYYDDILVLNVDDDKFDELKNGDEELVALVEKQFPPDAFLSLLSDTEKKWFFVREMTDYVVIIELKKEQAKAKVLNDRP